MTQTTTNNHQVTAEDYFKAKLDFDMSPYGLHEALEEGTFDYVIVDVRGTEQFAAGHIPKAISIPLKDLPGKLKTLPKDKTIVTYCGSITCQLAPTAALELAQKGFKVKELHGGIKEWTAMGFPVEK